VITEGNLRDFSLADLLQILELNRATGTLTLTHRGRSGTLQGVEGRIVGARLGDRGGEEAIYALFHWDGGSFTFSRDLSSDTLPPVSAEHSDLVREGIRRMDAWKRIRRECPAMTSGACLFASVAPLSDDPDHHLTAISRNPGGTLTQLAQGLGAGVLPTADRVLALWKDGHVQILAAPDVALSQGFRLALQLLHTTFASISGLKMVAAFGDRLVELIESQSVPLGWNEGQLVDDWLDDVSVPERTAVYHHILSGMMDHAVRLHGSPFEDRFLERLRQVWPPELHDIGERLGLAIAPPPASPVTRRPEP
jgi:hypothetical protein